MDELPTALSFRRIRFKLEAAGFDEVKQLGNHAKFVRRNGSEIRTAILPHYTEISSSTLRSILTQAGIKKEDFDLL
ncbi:MAG: type II toxin-antitoxin system HicA family toxin [Candidatus Obscuribacterales bacterium]|nr:type II toxin-antitoxin system HicA family toxin [Candidatus Obscuribacterales bacterium]